MLKNHKINDKKILHKIGKHWAVISIAILGVIGGIGAYQTNANAFTYGGPNDASENGAPVPSGYTQQSWNSLENKTEQNANPYEYYDPNTGQDETDVAASVGANQKEEEESEAQADQEDISSADTNEIPAQQTIDHDVQRISNDISSMGPLVAESGTDVVTTTSYTSAYNNVLNDESKLQDIDTSLLDSNNSVYEARASEANSYADNADSIAMSATNEAAQLNSNSENVSNVSEATSYTSDNFSNNNSSDDNSSYNSSDNMDSDVNINIDDKSSKSSKKIKKSIKKNKKYKTRRILTKAKRRINRKRNNFKTKKSTKRIRNHKFMKRRAHKSYRIAKLPKTFSKYWNRTRYVRVKHGFKAYEVHDIVPEYKSKIVKSKWIKPNSKILIKRRGIEWMWTLGGKGLRHHGHYYWMFNGDDYHPNHFKKI